MRFTLFTILFFTSLSIFAQKDSLNFYVKAAETENRNGNYKQALTNYLKVAFIQENAQDDKNLVSTYEAIGSLYQKKQIFQKSLDYFLNAYQIHKKLNASSEFIRSLQQVGMGYYLVNNLPNATKYYEEGLALAKQQKDANISNKASADILSKLFFIAQSAKQNDKAIIYANESLVLYETLKDTLAISNMLNNVGFLYREQNDTKKANDYFQKSLILNQKLASSKNGENRAIILQNIGIIYTNLSDDKNAIKSFNEALTIRQKIANPSKLAESHNYVAKHYTVEEFYDRAEKEALIAIELAKQVNDYKNLVDSYKILAEISRKNGDYKKSDEYNRLREVARDSLSNQKDKNSQVFQQKQITAERQESEYRLILAEKQKQELVLQQLKLESDKKQQELEINQQKLASLEKDKTIQAAESQRQIAENLRVQQDLEISRQKLLTEQREQQVATLQKEQALQALALEQQKRKSDEYELQRTKSESANKLAEQEREKAQQKANFILFSILGAGLLLVVILGIVVWSFIQKRKDNEKLQKQAKVIIESNEELRSSEEEIRQNLEELVATQEQLKVQYDLLAAKNKNIADSINYAKRIQTALLPRLAEIRTSFPDSFVLFRPRDVISGDFYWFANKGDMQIIVAADCTGHGVPGAFMSMLGSSLLNQIVHDKEISKPNEILDLLHTGVEEMLNQRHEDNTNRDGMDASICIINRKKNIIKFAGANNPMYVLSQKPLSFITETSTENIRIEQAKSWQLTEIKADKKPIGGRVIKQDDLYYTLHLFELDQEMRIYLFSDGFIDQIGGEARKRLMSKGFKRLLIDHHQIPFDEQGIILENFFENWIYETRKQLDDVMLLGIKIEK
jgi:tetratricopeptide (TPR) repeat protein